MGRAPELVSQLTTKATVAHAALRKLNNKVDKDDPDLLKLRHMLEDTITILRNLQLEVNA